MTPSLANFFWSIGFGIAVLGFLAALIFLASLKDKTVRRG
jgi:Photosystem II reaction centre X protein (PsbX)